MRFSKTELNKVATHSDINTYLQFSRGVSRGYETNGYPIVRLKDTNSGMTYKCSGGNYDMHGTNLGHYLKDLVNSNKAALQSLATAIYNELIKKEGIPYGLTIRNMDKLKDKEGKIVPSKVRKAIMEKNFYLDGACGDSCMYRIAQMMGLNYKERYDRARTRRGTDKFLGVEISVDPEGILARYLLKEEISKNVPSTFNP